MPDLSAEFIYPFAIFLAWFTRLPPFSCGIHSAANGDIEKDRTRTRLAKKLKNFGPRVQKSVFEADVKEEELQKLREILNKVKLDKEDSIRLYQLCAACDDKITIWGVGEVTKDEDYYLV